MVFVFRAPLQVTIEYILFLTAKCGVNKPSPPKNGILDAANKLNVIINVFVEPTMQPTGVDF
jgi:hypothetical protein